MRIELREVRELLEGAERIADGLVAVCEHAYHHDGRASDALAAANTAAVALSEAREAAEKREDAAVRLAKEGLDAGDELRNHIRKLKQGG